MTHQDLRAPLLRLNLTIEHKFPKNRKTLDRRAKQAHHAIVVRVPGLLHPVSGQAVSRSARPRCQSPCSLLSVVASQARIAFPHGEI
jgi:hypothetical protein